MKSLMKSPSIVMKCRSSLSASYEIIIGNLMIEIHRQLMKPFHCRVWHYTHSSAGNCLFIIIKVVTTSRFSLSNSQRSLYCYRVSLTFSYFGFIPRFILYASYALRVFILQSRAQFVLVLNRWK
jgi:hypothetical protein